MVLPGATAYRPSPRTSTFAAIFDGARVQLGSNLLDVDLEVLLVTPGLQEKGLPPHRVALSSTRYMYWTVAQLITHHASNGCPLQPGDLFGLARFRRPRLPVSAVCLKPPVGGS